MKKTTLLPLAGAFLIMMATPGLFSCNEPNTVGLEVQPESDQPNLAFTDTVTIKTEVSRADSAQTYGGFIANTSALLGSMYDTELGQSTADLYSQIVPSLTSPDLDSAVYDSLVLTFSYKSYYGDSAAQQTFTVYELDEALSEDSSYYSNQSFAVKAGVLGSLTFAPFPNTSVITGNDTLAPHLRVKLDDGFGQNLFNNIKTNGWLASADVFLSNLKGVKVQCTGVTSGGGIITYDPGSSLSGMRLYYTDTAGTDSSKVIPFLMSGAPRCNQLNHDYTGSAIGNVFPVVVNDKAYVQAMAGLRTKVTFPNMNSLKAIMPVAINKAELVITVDPGSTSTLAANASFGLARLDSVGKLLLIPEQVLEGTGYFGGSLNNNTYRFNIARYLQQVLSGELEDYGLYILPSNSGTTPNRAVIGAGANPNQSLRLKLQLTYTKLNP